MNLNLYIKYIFFKAVTLQGGTFIPMNKLILAFGASLLQATTQYASLLYTLLFKFLIWLSEWGSENCLILSENYTQRIKMLWL